MLSETILVRQRNLQDVVAKAGFLRLAAGGPVLTFASADLFGGEHDRFSWRTDGCQSGDRLGADGPPGGVQQHEPALLLVVISLGSSRAGARTGNARNDPPRRDRRQMGTGLVPESQ